MKIALCLSGLPRCIEYSKDLLIKNLITPLNADIYIHTWQVGIKESHKPDLRLPFSNITDQLDWFIKNLQPKNIIIEKYEDTIINPMFYSIRKSILQALNKKYDILIRCRMDNFFDMPIPNEELEECIRNKNRVFVRAQGEDFGAQSCRNYFKYEENNNEPFVQDNFAFGSEKSMEVYSRVGLLKEKRISEVLLGKVLFDNHIEPKLSKMKFDMFFKLEDKKIFTYNFYEGFNKITERNIIK